VDAPANASDLPAKDLAILRRLGEETSRVADGPENCEKRQAWYALDSGDGDRTMILAESGGICDEKKPMDPVGQTMECTHEWARGIEYFLRDCLFRVQHLRDDFVLEPFIGVGWPVSSTGFGVEVVMEHGEGVVMGARRWDHPIKDLDKDLEKLQHRTFSVDREPALRRKELLEDVFQDTLGVRMRGGHFWTMGLTWNSIELIGLEGLMLYMYDNPDGLHALLGFLRDDNVNFVEWLEKEGLFTLNNENDYIGSGSQGYTHDLPMDQSSTKVTARDLWVLLESQETVGVGPDQYEEFIFPYELSLAERFGKTYYGCCEPVNNRWHVLKRFPNIARVSVSPWADQSFMAEACGRDYVFSRKPNPTLISTDVCDDEAIRADLRSTLDVAGDCKLEILMKDVHTLNNEPDRLARWIQLAREEAAR